MTDDARDDARSPSLESLRFLSANLRPNRNPLAVEIVYADGGGEPVLRIVVTDAALRLDTPRLRIDPGIGGARLVRSFQAELGRIPHDLPAGAHLAALAESQEERAAFAETVLAAARRFLRVDRIACARGDAEQMMRRLQAASDLSGDAITALTRVEAGRRPAWATQRLARPFVHVLGWHDPIGGRPDLESRTPRRRGLMLSVHPAACSGHRRLEAQAEILAFYAEAREALSLSDKDLRLAAEQLGLEPDALAA